MPVPFVCLSFSGTPFSFSVVRQFGMIKFLFIRHSSVAVISPALQTLGNIVTGDNAQKQVERRMYNYLLILVKACLP